AADAARIDVAVGQRFLEGVEAGVGSSKAVGEGDLDKAGIGSVEPACQPRAAAGKLRAHRAAVEAVLEGDDDVFFGGDVRAVRASELDAAFSRFGAGGQQEDTLERRGQPGGKLLNELETNLGREAIGVIQPVVGH